MTVNTITVFPHAHQEHSIRLLWPFTAGTALVPAPVRAWRLGATFALLPTHRLPIFMVGG